MGINVYKDYIKKIVNPIPTPAPIKDIITSGGQTTAGTGLNAAGAINRAVATAPQGGGAISPNGPSGRLGRIGADITKSLTNPSKIAAPSISLSSISPNKNLSGQFGQLPNGNNYIHDLNGVPQSLHDMGDGRFYFIDSSGIKKILDPQNLPKTLGGPIQQGQIANLSIDEKTPENLAKNLEAPLIASSPDPVGTYQIKNMLDRFKNSGQTWTDFIDTIATGGNPIQEKGAEQIFGSRSPGERITGKESTVDPWKQNPSAANPNNSGGSDPFTAQDPNKTPSGQTKVTFYDKSPWESILGNYTDDPNVSKIGTEGKASYLNLVSQNEDPNAVQDPINRRYGLLQQNLAAQNAGQTRQEQDALSRRFASMGALNSGAALRNMSMTQDASSRRLGELSNNLAAQQSAEQQAATEAAYQRNMQREAQRLASEESMRGRNLQAQQSQQGAFDTAMQRNMTRDAQRIASDQEARALKLEGEKIVEGARQSDLEYDLNKRISEANLKMQQKMLDNPGNIITSLFGNLSMENLLKAWGLK